MTYHQRGFTLVELAISLMVIGILIGGVLKGQELLNNARATSTAQQFTSIKTAVALFQARYNALPGDIANPAQRLPACTTSPCADTATPGDKFIGNVPGCCPVNPPEAFQTFNVENGNFWLHLLKTNLLSGTEPNPSYGVPLFGVAMPAAKIGGGFIVSGWSGWGPYVGGNQLQLQNATTGDANSNPVMTALQAQIIDKKLDDGKPYAGDVRGSTAGYCADVVSAEYNEGSKGNLCALVFMNFPRQF